MKIGVETRTPTPLGEARTVLEFDWAGSTTFAPGGANPTAVSDNLIPRLRYAYGTLGGFLAGQATSNFSDPDANSETLDFGCNVGEPGHVRVPQVRYTMPAPFGGSFSVSAETPETDIGYRRGVEGSDAGVIPTVTTTCAFRRRAARRHDLHLDAAGQRPAAAQHRQVDRARLHRGVVPAAGLGPPRHFGGDPSRPRRHRRQVLRPSTSSATAAISAWSFRPGWFGWAKDYFNAHLTVGEALGNFLNSSTNFALATNYGAAGKYGSFGGPTTAAAAAAILVKPTFEWGSDIGYQHWWTGNLRSNINAGFNQHQIPANIVGAAQAGAMNKELLTFHANLIWNPVSSVDVGLEYMWGQRTVVNNGHGTENVLISKLAFRF